MNYLLLFNEKYREVLYQQNRFLSSRRWCESIDEHNVVDEKQQPRQGRYHALADLRKASVLADGGVQREQKNCNLENKFGIKFNN